MSTPMHTTLPAAALRPHVPLHSTLAGDGLAAGAHASNTLASSSGGIQTPCLQSNALFQGHNSVAIQHNGAIYRLQATKLGKLILTK